jgi:putative tryptophan/tyrosine transport system substrate-binding protein
LPLLGVEYRPEGIAMATLRQGRIECRLAAILAGRMGRRQFLALLAGAAAAWPLAVRAQQPDRVRRIGVLGVPIESDPQSQRRAAAFREGLEKLGWTVGRNLQVDYRWGISDDEQARSGAAELLRLAPDLVLANSPPAVRAMQQAAPTMPIVFVAVSEPVSLGLVASLAHPGGNTTGFTNLEPSVAGKWLELLKGINPRTARVALMFSPDGSPLAPLFFRSMEAAAPKFAVDTVMVPVHELAETEVAMTELGRESGCGLIFPPDTFTTAHHKAIVELAARYQLPAIYAFQYFAAAGGLVSYGPDVVDQFRRAAAYVDRILRGERAGDLPVQQPTKFELVINIKTAKALGLTVPTSLLARADEVIE